MTGHPTLITQESHIKKLWQITNQLKFERILVFKELLNVEVGNAHHDNNMCGEFIDYIHHQPISLKSWSKAEKFQFSWCFVGWDSRCICVWERDQIGSDGEFVVKTELLGLAEVKHAHTEGIK